MTRPPASDPSSAAVVGRRGRGETSFGPQERSRSVIRPADPGGGDAAPAAPTAHPATAVRPVDGMTGEPGPAASGSTRRATPGAAWWARAGELAEDSTASPPPVVMSVT